MRWETQFIELQAFQKRLGHCDVSSLSKTNAVLGRWAKTQRDQRLQGILNEERIGLFGKSEGRERRLKMNAGNAKEQAPF